MRETNGGTSREQVELPVAWRPSGTATTFFLGKASGDALEVDQISGDGGPNLGRWEMGRFAPLVTSFHSEPTRGADPKHRSCPSLIS